MLPIIAHKYFANDYFVTLSMTYITNINKYYMFLYLKNV